MNFLVGIYLFLFFFGILFTVLFLILHFRYRKELFDSPEITEEYSLSIVIPCYNEEESIGDTIKQTLETDYKNLKKVLVVDDCSSDSSYEIIKKYASKYEKVVALQTPKNTGCAGGAKNYGLEHAETELVGFSDADSYPKKNAISKMIGYFDNPKVAAVTSRVLVQNKKNALERFQILDYSIIAWTRKLLDFVDAVYVTNGPLSIYRTDVIKKLGGFNIKNLTEDIEITWNLLSKGYKTRMSYGAIVYTVVPDNIKEWVNQRIRWNLGGLQTVVAYRKDAFRHPENSFGYFVLPYVSAAFLFAIVGFLLMIRFFWIKGSYYFIALSYLFRGYNLFHYLEFSYLPTVLLFLAGMFMILTVFYYKVGFLNSETGKKNIIKIFLYAMVYRTLYVVPLILAIYKIVKRDFRWYTK